MARTRVICIDFKREGAKDTSINAHESSEWTYSRTNHRAELVTETTYSVRINRMGHILFEHTFTDETQARMLYADLTQA